MSRTDEWQWFGARSASAGGKRKFEIRRYALRSSDAKYSIAVEKIQSLYTLLVDNVADVRALPDSGLESVPPNLDAQFRLVMSGV